MLAPIKINSLNTKWQFQTQQSCQFYWSLFRFSPIVESSVMTERILSHVW